MEGGGGNDGGDALSNTSMSRQPSQTGNEATGPETQLPEVKSEATPESNPEDQETPVAANTSSSTGDGADATPTQADDAEAMDIDTKTAETSPEEQLKVVAAATAAMSAPASTGIAIDPSLDAMEIVGSTSADTAASLISLAGGASKILDGFSLSTYESYGEPPSSTALGNDGPHTTLPPLGSIRVLADLATQEGSSQQQQNQGNWRRLSESRTMFPPMQTNLNLSESPSNRAATTQGIGSPSGLTTSPSRGPSFTSSDGSRPPIHHLSLQSQGHFMNLDQSSPYYQPQHQHYPPIKDPQTTSGASPDPTFAAISGLAAATGGTPAGATTPNSANLFAQGYNASAPAKQENRPEIYGLDQISLATQAVNQISTPAGPSTGDTMSSTSTDEGRVRPSGRGRPRGSGHASPGGGFRCDYPGCKAPPFQTQYLLNSHANVHSSERPHFCPVPGCPRAVGGKGFKRKNEMIRHGLVHDSPGYICPFCPQREHKYPRPDNLQRHVRVHHMDKDKDDPLLRDVLSQRPEGGNRGRRRRAVGSAGLS